VSCRSSEPQYFKAKSNDRQGKMSEPNSIVLAMAKKEMPQFPFAGMMPAQARNLHPHCQLLANPEVAPWSSAKRN
jgi:hypothetical protein